ncbi:hypothetical protein SAMN06265222_117120 [Neorhodopirellula lusitana]|uniref:Uncharacterized protein n=1 Tax=Neorhodopirellula lusitana TaxID=445327 RepID=A0ABY1QN53_9BACT|nr:hypothetical protein SAMN06265222_117120 [Neorhodopirellula lusitana]
MTEDILAPQHCVLMNHLTSRLLGNNQRDDKPVVSHDCLLRPLNPKARDLRYETLSREVIASCSTYPDCSTYVAYTSTETPRLLSLHVD